MQAPAHPAGQASSCPWGGPVPGLGSALLQAPGSGVLLCIGTGRPLPPLLPLGTSDSARLPAGLRVAPAGVAAQPVAPLGWARGRESLGKPPPRLAPSRTLACPKASLKPPRQRPDQNPFPRAASLPSGHPAAIVTAVCLGHLLLDISEMGFPRVAGAAPSQYCSPSALSVPSTSPLPWLHQVFPGLTKPAQHFPPLRSLCVELCC